MGCKKVEFIHVHLVALNSEVCPLGLTAQSHSPEWNMRSILSTLNAMYLDP